MSEPNKRLALAKRALGQKTLIIEALKAELAEERSRRRELEALHTDLLTAVLDFVTRTWLCPPGRSGG